MDTKEFLKTYMNDAPSELLFNRFLLCMQEEHVTTKLLLEDPWLREDVTRMIIQYLLFVGFRGKARTKLIISHSDFHTAASHIALEILRSMDRVLACDPDGMIKFIQNILQKRTIDLVRAYNRAHPVIVDKDDIELPRLVSIGNELCDSIEDTSTVSTEETVIALETKMERRLLLLTVLRALDQLSRFEATSLLSTKALGFSPSAVAEMIDSSGLLLVSQAILEKSRRVLRLKDIPVSFNGDEIPAYASKEILTKEIAKAAKRGQTSLRRISEGKSPVKRR